MPTEVLAPPETGEQTDAQSLTSSTPKTAAEQVLEKLNGLFLPAESLRWLGAPLRDFGASPIELIAQGRGEIILHILIRLEEGIPL